MPPAPNRPAEIPTGRIRPAPFSISSLSSIVEDSTFEEPTYDRNRPRASNPGMTSETAPRATAGIAWAAGAAAMAGSFVIPWKLATPHSDESTIVLVLLTSAALLNSLIVPFSTPEGARWSGRAMWLSVLLAVLTLAGNLASAFAIERLSAPLLSVLQRAEVLVVAIIAWIVLRERPHVLFWVGAAVAAGGLVWMQGGNGDLDGVGILYGLGSSLCFGSMLVAVRRYIDGVDAVFVNAFRLWLSVGAWFAVHRTVPTIDDLSAPLVLYGALAGLFGPFLSRLFSMQSALHLEARFTALILLSSPVLSLPLAWAFLGTIPSGAELEGGFLMLLGIAIPVVGMLWARDSARAPEPRPVPEPAHEGTDEPAPVTPSSSR